MSDKLLEKRLEKLRCDRDQPWLSAEVVRLYLSCKAQRDRYQELKMLDEAGMFVAYMKSLKGEFGCFLTNVD